MKRGRGVLGVLLRATPAVKRDFRFVLYLFLIQKNAPSSGYSSILLYMLIFFPDYLAKSTVSKHFSDGFLHSFTELKIFRIALIRFTKSYSWNFRLWTATARSQDHVIKGQK
jgi:hypothetical protein